MTDKVIVSNKSALTENYGNNGLTKLTATLNCLITADAARNLNTTIVWVDDTAQIHALGGRPPTSREDEKGNKAAVDAIVDKLSPDYIVLLDGPDVIPHIALDNFLPND